MHVEWGEPIGNYDEFRFFTGLRQSEEIALRTLDCNLEKATIEIRQVIVLAREKDRTKSKEDRTVELCPRALSVLKRQLALREQYLQAGKIDHDLVFFKDDGEPIRSLKYLYMRWRYARSLRVAPPRFPSVIEATGIGTRRRRCNRQLNTTRGCSGN